MSAPTSSGYSRPLHSAHPGERLQLDWLTGGNDMKAHLASLGFVPGTEVEVLSSTRNGPLIVSVKAGKLILSQGIAKNIWVS